MNLQFIYLKLVFCVNSKKYEGFLPRRKLVLHSVVVNPPQREFLENMNSEQGLAAVVVAVNSPDWWPEVTFSMSNTVGLSSALNCIQ